MLDVIKTIRIDDKYNLSLIYMETAKDYEIQYSDDETIFETEDGYTTKEDGLKAFDEFLSRLQEEKATQKTKEQAEQINVEKIENAFEEMTSSEIESLYNMHNDYDIKEKWVIDYYSRQTFEDLEDDVNICGFTIITDDEDDTSRVDKNEQ